MSHIKELIIRHYQSEDQLHQGRRIAHNALRKAGYWIINGRSSIAHQLTASPRDSKSAYFCPFFHVWTFSALGYMKERRKEN